LNEIIECIPNFSTSQPKAVDTIINEIKKVEGAFLLDRTFDDYYNRLVVTFVGDRKAVLKAALASAVKAVELIDMRKHKGQHPRIGAVDIVPFVPIKNSSLTECVALAKEFGKQFAQKSKIPVYLYGEAASKPERSDIDWIRKGEYEKLAEMMKQSDRKPDYGPDHPHPTAGATITGARKIMAGFNVNMGTSDLTIARKIAGALHSRKGGFAYVKAMAASIPEKGITQIGMSINDYEKTPLYRVFEVIKVEAARYNVPILGSEFCGMAPLQAVLDSAAYYMKVDNLTMNQVLEIAVQNAMEKKAKTK
jgi:glutamate formiminotransferase